MRADSGTTVQGDVAGLSRLLEGRRLSPAQRRIGQYLSEHLTEAIFLSSVELAERVGVSQPSVTRFAVALGFAGYPEMLGALRPLVLPGLAAGRREEGTTGNEWQGAVDAEVGNLLALRERLTDPTAVAELGVALAGSKPLPVLGLRVSAGLATTFAYVARRVHPDLRLLVSGGSTLLDELYAAYDAGASWLLAFVMPRYPAETVHALRRARELGLRTAVITDRRDALARLVAADAFLEAGVSERLVFDAQGAPLVLSMILVEAMADADPVRTQRRLEMYERADEGVFLP
ncbi:MurR/RpiR family transcriptional regulator [Rhizohabitans arisaemae]|uniref:MurR/RpiR family transcriptional regulator n=1 Tax=Rhizohabitans arisaemae TaxID=2720610 RepID=UPI0024B15306|nr:MurR/RpiR family transcriptional regulator [Rhizohabitans arisaemae]